MTDEAKAKVKVLNRRDLGWAVRWSDGSESWMPDEVTANQCASATDLYAACKEAASQLRAWLAKGSALELADDRPTLKKLDAALRRAEGKGEEVTT